MSKYRNDFVTNSSSSSFIIAKRSNFKRQELVDELNKHRDKILSFIGEVIECFCVDDEISDTYKNNKEKCIDLFIEQVVDELMYFDKYNSLQLDGWIAKSENYSNEYDMATAFIYDYGYLIDIDNFKVYMGD